MHRHSMGWKRGQRGQIHFAQEHQRLFFQVYPGRIPDHYGQDHSGSSNIHDCGMGVRILCQETGETRTLELYWQRTGPQLQRGISTRTTFGVQLPSEEPLSSFKGSTA